MKKALISLLFLTQSAVAFAGVKLELTSLESGWATPIGEKVAITPNADGTLNLILVPSCIRQGCDRAETVVRNIDPVVIYDRRSGDGNLLLRLLPDSYLEVSSGHNRLERVGFTFIRTSRDGGETQRVQLTPKVQLDLKK